MGICQATDMMRFWAFALLLALTAWPSSSRATWLKITVRDYTESPPKCNVPNGMIRVAGSNNEDKDGTPICWLKCKSDTLFGTYCEREFKVLRMGDGRIFPQHCGTCSADESYECVYREAPGMAEVKKYRRNCTKFEKHCRDICSEIDNSLLNCDVLKIRRDNKTCHDCNDICKDMRIKKCEQTCLQCGRYGNEICHTCNDICKEMLTKKCQKTCGKCKRNDCCADCESKCFKTRIIGKPKDCYGPPHL